MVTFYSNQIQASVDASARKLRERAVCFVARGKELVHVPSAGVQLVTGGLEAGETPENAAVRALLKQPGLALTDPQSLVSYLLQGEPPGRFAFPVQVCHADAFAPPATTPHTWQRHADDHLFAFRWADLCQPALDWEINATLPHLITAFAQGAAL